MCNVSRFSISLLFILSFANLLSAQEPRGFVGPKLSPVITAAAAGEKVRFSSPEGIAQIRVQVISAAGDPLFDSAWKDGNVLDWPVESPGRPLANGSHRCVVMVKDLDGQVTRREAVLTAEGGQVSIESRAGNEGLTVVGAGESSPKITVLVHDEKNGAIVNTSGDLSFRFGEFFAGKDNEKMRLTAAGSLGIGTDQPQAPLDVNGLIRTSKGIMFADGTILTTASGVAAATPGGGANRLPPGVVGGAALGSPATVLSARPARPAAAPAAQFVVDGTGVHIGTSAAYGLDVQGAVNTDSGEYRIFGQRVLAVDLLNGSTAVGSLTGSVSGGGSNSFFGHLAGQVNTGASNAFFGYQSGTSNSSGNSNSFFGMDSGEDNQDGNYNSASGESALLQNVSGHDNTAFGRQALYLASTSYNTAGGSNALHQNSTGDRNTAFGAFALHDNVGGSRNVALGVDAGYFAGGSYNIEIGNTGLAGDDHTIRIGDVNQSSAFISGIRGRTTGTADAVAVVIDSSGQLGTFNSSRRYKFDIASMGDATADLMRLRPVTFRYLAHGDNAPQQYGLIAEEVAEVYPQLVARNKDGEVETVLYHFLAPMLLNEVQKQHRQIEEQRETIAALNQTLDAVVQRLQALEKQMARSN